MIERIREDIKRAMKAGEKEKVSVLRMALAGIKNAQISKGGELDEGEILSVLQKEARKRVEAATAFRDGGREERALEEEAEMEILKDYLPQPLSAKELERVVDEAIAEVAAAGKRDFGPVMKAIMGRYRGRVDGKQVQTLVSSKLP